MKPKSIRTMAEAQRLTKKALADGSIEEFKPDWDQAKNYAADQMQMLEKMKPSTAFMAAILTLVGTIGATTADHGPEVQDYVEGEAIKILKRELASLRSYLNDEARTAERNAADSSLH